MIRISVVVPTFKRRPRLKQCLLKLCAQTMEPFKYEIMVCDDEDNEKTRALLTEVGEQYPLHHLRYVGVFGSHGPAAARNCGWKKAKGEIIAFTDDDCLPETDWLASALENFNGLDAAWGKVVVPLPVYPSDYQVNVSKLAQAGFVTANCFCRREVLEEIGGFDERFRQAWREDSDLYFNLIEHDFRVGFIPKALVIHPAPKLSGKRSLVLQKNNFYEHLLYKKHPALYRKIAQLPIIYFFLTIVIALVLSLTVFHSSTRMLGLAALSIWMVLTLFFVLVRLRNTSHSIKEVLEIMMTSICIPPLAIYWRVLGNIKFRNV